MVAARDIAAGEAITWSYAIDQSFYTADYLRRNLALINHFNFVCRCERCVKEIPEALVELPDLEEFFRGLLMYEAMELVKTLMRRR